MQLLVVVPPDVPPEVPPDVPPEVPPDVPPDEVKFPNFFAMTGISGEVVPEHLNEPKNSEQEKLPSEPEHLIEPKNSEQLKSACPPEHR